MAYNPFDFFRKHQKVLFAGLTVMVMFMFILSFGQGDFFSWFPRQMEKWQTSGEVMAVIDGSKVKESQLNTLSADRRLANGYMQQAADRAVRVLGEEYKKTFDGSSAEYKQKNFMQSPQFLGIVLSGQFGPVEPQLAEMAKTADATAESEIAREEDRKAAAAFAQYLRAFQREIARRTAAASDQRDRSSRDEVVYFTNQPDRDARDQLEFMLWLKKADQLGIRYTHDDVRKLVEAEFPAGVSADDLNTVLGEYVGKSGRPGKEVLDALADEFRVRAAQAAVIGLGEIRDPSAVPAAAAKERLDHFLDVTTTTKYTFLTIPVEAYLPQVQGEPTRDELNKLFLAAVRNDPDPGSPRPGIREPRKVTVQWVEVTGQEAYYDALATARTKAIPAAQAVFGPAATQDGPFRQYDYGEYLKGQASTAEYRRGRSGNPGRQELSWEGMEKVDATMAVAGGGWGDRVRDEVRAKGGKNVTSQTLDGLDDLLDAEVFRPEVVASLAGLTAGGAATYAPVRAAEVAVTESAYRQSRERRLLAGLRAFHLPTLDGLPELVARVGGEAAVQAAAVPPLSEAAVRPVLDRVSADQLRAVIATEDVRAFQKRLAEITKKDTAQAKKEEREAARKEAADYVAKFISDRGLKTGGTTEPRDVMTLADDPGLAPLLQREERLLGVGGRPSNPRARVAFAQPFLLDIKPAEASQLRQAPGQLSESRQVYAPRVYAPPLARSERDDYAPDPAQAATVGPQKPLTLFWRTTDKDADQHASLNDPKAVEKVKAIWRMNKARELARNAADKAAEVIRQAGDNPAKVGLQVQEALGKLKEGITDPNVLAKFVERTPVQFETAKLPMRTEFVSPFNPPTLVDFNPGHELIVYETDKMREDLIANRDKPVGTTFVFTDRPETMLYLTVVASRDPKPAELFREFVLYPTLPPNPQAGGRTLSPEVVAPRFAAAAREADRKQAVALLKAEFGYTGENTEKLNQKAE